jgi:hypothetical protein
MCLQMLLLMLVGMLLRSWRQVPYVGLFVAPVVSCEQLALDYTGVLCVTVSQTGLHLLLLKGLGMWGLFVAPVVSHPAFPASASCACSMMCMQQVECHCCCYC